MTPLKSTFAVFLFAFASVSIAQQKSLPNGCGTGWNRYFVPDSIPVLQCNFKEACNAHDNCYARCEDRIDQECEYRRCRPGGDLDGKPVCFTDARYLTLANEAGQRRKVCDMRFYSDIRKLNIGKMSCRAFAVIYRDAVKLWGGSAFIGVEQAPELTQQQQDYEKAIRDFFVQGTEAQFKRIVEEDEAERKVVDMKRNVQFTKESGLVNSN